MAIGKHSSRGIGAALAAVFLLLGTSAYADLFTFSDEFSGSGDTCANVSCATLEVTQDGSDVKFELKADLASGEFITGLYGNIDPFQFANSIYSNVEDDDVSGWSLTGGLDCCKADGDGNFDYAWGWGNGELTGTEKFGWTFLNVTISDIVNAISQDGPEGKNGFTFALRVQGLGEGNEGSGWFNAVNREVPEPGTLVLLGIGLAGLGMAKRRRIV